MNISFKPSMHTLTKCLAGIGVAITWIVSFSCLAADLSALKEDVKYLTNQNLHLYKTNPSGDINKYHLPRGLYIVTETIRLSCNSILQGDGIETILKVAPRFKGSRFITNNDLQQGNHNITLSSFKVEFDIRDLPGDLPGVMRFENVNNLTITDISVEADTKYYCIDLSAVINNATIKRCIIKNQGSGGGIQVRNRNALATHGSKNIRISENRVTSITDEPIAVFGWLGDVADVIVENNTINAHRASFGITAYGIDKPTHTGHLNNITIIGNTVRGSRNGAISAKGGACDVRIEDNQLGQTGNDGIFIDNGGLGLPAVQNISITRNTIDDSGRYGIYAKGLDIIIDGNVISRSRGAGVFVSGKGGGQIDVLNNRITAAGKSIVVSGAVKGIIAGNQLQKPNDILRLEK